MMSKLYYIFNYLQQEDTWLVPALLQARPIGWVKINRKTVYSNFISVRNKNG
jgi:hypothetical protein